MIQTTHTHTRTHTHKEKKKENSLLSFASEQHSIQNFYITTNTCKQSAKKANLVSAALGFQMCTAVSTFSFVHRSLPHCTEHVNMFPRMTCCLWWLVHLVLASVSQNQVRIHAVSAYNCLYPEHIGIKIKQIITMAFTFCKTVCFFLLFFKFLF